MITQLSCGIVEILLLVSGINFDDSLDNDSDPILFISHFTF